MNKKKLLTLAMVVSMVAILAIGSTIAYFTSTDYNVNVMVTGNVKIDQREQQRVDGNAAYVDGREEGTLVEYEDGGKLFPVTHPTFSGYQGKLAVSNNLPGTNATGDNYGGYAVQLFNTDNNYIDKIVTIHNTGDSEAYVRSVFAFQMGKVVTKDEDGKDQINWVSLIGHDGDGVLCYCAGSDLEFLGEEIEIDGVKYELAVAYYDTLEGKGTSLLQPDEVSAPSLTQIFMNESCTNEDAALLGDDYRIIVLSQGTQTEGFTSAKQALDQSFGVVDADNAYDWFTAEELESHDFSAEADEEDGGENVFQPAA